MDFQSAMETFAEAWVAATAGHQTQALALTRPKSRSPIKKEDRRSSSPQSVHDLSDHSPSIVTRESPKSNHLTNDLPVCLPTGRNPHTTNFLEKSPDIPSLAIQTSDSPINHITNTNVSTISSSISTGTTNQLSNHLAVNLKLPATTTNSISNSQLHGNENGNVPAINGGIGTIGYNLHDNVLPSPNVDRNAKSLPLHCVVESITSLQASICMETRTPWKRRPNIETDSYVIVPAATLFSEIVNTALQRLGYSADIANTARGSIIIKNWKPLPLEKISDSPMTSVGDILGELTSVVTLRIVILRSKPSTFAEIKDKLLKLLVLQSHAVLRSAGCPLDEITLSQICRNSYHGSFPFPSTGDISEEMRRKFDQWWSNQLTPQVTPIAPKLMPFINHHHHHQISHHGSDLDYTAGANTTPNVNHIQQSLHASRESLLIDKHHPLVGNHNMIVHPALQTVHSQYPNQKTRMRTSFDPEMELPKLQRWFHENPHPSRQQIQSYVIQLNALDSRRGRKPLDVNNVVYWFKNARAAQKRAELRGQVPMLGNGYGGPSSEMMMPHADYLKSPMSLKSEDIDNISQHSDDLDDDLDHPPSPPQLPLSLTTHQRHRSLSRDNMSKLGRDQSSSPSRYPHPNSINNNNSNNIANNNSISNNNNENSSNTGNSITPTPIQNHNQICDQSEMGHLIDDMNDTNHQSSTSIKGSPKSDDLDMEESDNLMEDFRSPSPDSRRDLPFPMVPNSMFSHSIMYMSHYIPQMGGAQAGHPGPNNSNPLAAQSALNLAALSNDERRKRNRTFIDPVTEVPKLEQWFAMNTHPSHNLILKYTEDLNRMPYRQKFPRLESKNVQFWFKNRRAKCKRLKMSLYDPVPKVEFNVLGPFAHGGTDRD